MKVDQGSFANVAFAKKSQDGLLYMKFSLHLLQSI